MENMDTQRTATASLSTAQVGWYVDPSDRTRLRWWDGATWTEHTAPLQQESTPSSLERSPLDDLPAIKNWQTSVGFSILGLFAPSLIQVVVGFIVTALSAAAFAGMPVDIVSSMAALITLPLFIILVVLQVTYVLVFYRSYFTDKPCATSPKAISFWNFFFGGWIFGALWNASLTRSRWEQRPQPGSAYFVFLVLLGVGVVFLILFLLMS